MLLDLGSGDGAGILAAASADASVLCIGLDADGAAPRRASHRASRPIRKGGLSNAIFLVGDATRLPQEFAGRVDELRIVLPWSSLLRAVLDADPDFVAGLERVLGSNGRLLVIASVIAADYGAVGHGPSGGELANLAQGLRAAGFRVTEHRLAVDDDLERVRSTWAKRLGVPGRRPASILVAHRQEG